MSNFTTLYNTAGLPTGTIVRGRINDPTWLPMNGGLYLKADYPELDTSQYLTFGNNTPQTASGTVVMQGTSLLSFAHNADYTRLVFCDSSHNLCRSVDGGLTWSNFTIPGMSVFSGVSFLNGQFVAYNSNQQFSTSSDLVTWAATSTFSLGISLSSIGLLEYFNGLYIVYAAPLSGTQQTIFTSPTLTSGSFTVRGPVIDPAIIWAPLANNNQRRGVVSGGSLRVGTQLSSTPQIFSTTDGINFVATSYSITSPLRANDMSITSSGFFTTKSGNLIAYDQGSTEYGGGSLNRTNLPYTTSGLVNFGNLFAHHAGGNMSADRLLVSESKYYLPNAYVESLPAGSSSGHRCAFTPTRLIIVPSNGASSGNVYYLNIDTTRFRLERPLIDGHFVDDAYIKAA